MSWASERRFFYAFSVTAGLLVLVGGIFFILFYEPANCFDGSENGTEIGVDCGGECAKLCPTEAAALKILWSRSFEVSPGRYNAVAYVENPNRHAGVKQIGYSFKLVDEKGGLISERKGSAFITPNGISPVFESDITTGAAAPARTFFEFTEIPVWYRAGSTAQSLSISNKRLLDTPTRPRLDALLTNESLEEFKDVEIVGIVFAADGNAVAASRTVIERLGKGESAPVVFTWPRPFEKRLEQCAIPADVGVLLDISGSMNDLGASPPQPLTDAKLAAASFARRLEENDRVGLVTFATDASIREVMTSLKESVAASIERVTIPTTEETGKTNIAVGLKRGSEMLRADTRAEDHSPVLVLLTDGRATGPTDSTAEPLALAQARSIKAEGVSIYTIGLGPSVNATFMTELASTPSHYFPAASGRDLEAIYREISTAICERGPAVVEIIPRSTSHLFVE